MNIVKGDLFNHIYDDTGVIIIHGCNAQGVMGSGFALQIKNKFPHAYEDYLDYCEETLLEYRLGSNNYSTVGKTTVINAITQKTYGRHPSFKYVSYDAVYDCLSEAVDFAKYTMRPILMPFIGGGLAHGNHKILMSIFEETVGRYNNTTLFIKD